MALLLALLVLLAALPAAAQDVDPPEREKLPPTITETSSGITIVRGGTTRAPAPPPDAAGSDSAEAEGGEETAESSEEGAEEETAETELPKSRRVSTEVLGVSGNPLGTAPTVREERTEDGSKRVVTTTSPNGREVRAVEETEQVSQRSGDVEVRERRIQRYGPDGRPVRQELVRTEERKLPDGTIETTAVRYEEDINGRMQPIERQVSREKTTGETTRTTTTTEAPTVNGRFAPVTREESVERRQGEAVVAVETTRLASEGGRMVEVGRERATTQKAGSTEKTETQVWERGGASGEMSLVSRSVGEKREDPSGAITERVETYSLGVGRTRNPNATGLALTKVVDRTVTVGRGGVQRERVETRERALNGSDEFTPPTVVEQTTTPPDEGATVRTEVREPTPNGRIEPVSVTVEQIEK